MMQHIILFYKYAPLSSDRTIMTMYQHAMHDLCTTLKLTGRVLVGMSDDAEGINGTLAGFDREDVLAYTYAMLGKKWCSSPENYTGEIVRFGSSDITDEDGDKGENARRGDNDTSRNANNFRRSEAVHTFWTKAESFFNAAKAPVLTLASPADFKWSSVGDSKIGGEDTCADDAVFPDLQIKLVKEIIGTGGVLSSITIKDTSEGYLTPKQWHEEMKSMKEAKNAGTDVDEDTDTVLIDCRNHKEFEIGHFNSAVDPNTKTFEQFPRWVQENKSALKNKKILMYCTGGIRCEKASAYVRNELKTVSDKPIVKHLHGGIHKYLDEFGSDGFFAGKNFVFDRRVGVVPGDHIKKEDNGTDDRNVVGQCLYCEKIYDVFTADAVCTVCRERTLACEDCKNNLFGEFHCSDHQHLKHCYFTNLSRFAQHELSTQLQDLESLLDEIAIGKRYKQKRRTLSRQIERVSKALLDLKSGSGDNNVPDHKITCRSCGDAECNGECWGVHGLKRKYVLEKESMRQPKKLTRPNANKRSKKIMQREKDILEIKELGLSKHCNVYRSNESGIRCPPAFFRELSTTVKGKWVGKSVQSVLQSEFHELSDVNRLNMMFKKSLIRVNNIPVNSKAALSKGVDKTKALSQDIQLKNMDIISRITHWHEPPVIVPEKISVNKVALPKPIIDEYISIANNDETPGDFSIYCCNKPSTVPVHPTGPYLQNSLSLMVEAQEGLEPRSLLPCHRIDRCTSGLTLFCTSPEVARILQVQMDKKMVEKSYVARVQGLFPSSQAEVQKIATKNNIPVESNFHYSFENKMIVVDAPIHVADVTRGFRAVHKSGKPSKSMFAQLSYDRESDTSLVKCIPVTGRQHQLRVHLKSIGFPIHNDILYGGIIDAREGSGMKTDVAQALRNTIVNSTLEGGKTHIGDISRGIISAAKDACMVCKGEFNHKFNSSQLLGGGHRIDLHAMAYRISFEEKRQKHKPKKRDGEGTMPAANIIGVVDCNSDPPDWMDL